MANGQVATTGTISGPAEQAAINTALLQAFTMFQAATAPTPTSTGLTSTAGVWWHDTGNNAIKVRNQADSAWITIGSLNESVNQFTVANFSASNYLAVAGGTMTGELFVQAGGVNIEAGGLVVGAGGATITGNVSITGNFAATGQVNGSTGHFDGAVGVGGQIYAGGGYKFGDGTVQTTAVTAVNLSGYAMTSQLGSYAPLSSPAFTGSPTAPRPSDTDNSGAIPTTNWVLSRIYTALSSYTATGTPSSGAGTGGEGPP